MTKRSSYRPTMADVAVAAGVGPATVDRVLNERGNVSEGVRRKVIDAARSLGLRRRLPPAYKPIIRIDLIFPRPDLTLLEAMARDFRKIVRATDQAINLQITTIRDNNPESIARALDSTSCNAVVVYGQDDPLIHEAVGRLADKGVPVVTIVTDLPKTRRLAYAGTDHHAAGRTAGFFCSQIARAPGPTIVLCSHLGFQAHSQRVAGFTEYLAENAPGFEIVRIVEGQDDEARSRALLGAAFKEFPDAVAVYNTGAANLGVRGAIEADILNQRPTLIGHELTKNTASMLRDGVMTLTLDQNPRLQAQFAVDVLLDHFGHEGIDVSPPYVSNVPIILYSAENIPPSA